MMTAMIRRFVNEHRLFVSALLLGLSCAVLLACGSGSHPANSFKHSDDHVHTAAISPSGEYALVATSPHSVEIWDLKKNSTAHTLDHQTHQISVIDSAISPDDTYALTAGKHSVSLWGLNTGNLYNSFELPGNIIDVALSNNGRHGLIALDNNTAIYVDLRTGNTLQTFQHNDKVTSVGLSRHGEFAITGSLDGTAKIWDHKTGQLLNIIEHDTPVNLVAISRLGTYAMTSGENTAIKIWHVEDGKLLRELEGPPKTLASARFSPDESLLAAGCKPQTLALWNVQTGELLDSWVMPKKAFWRPTIVNVLGVSFSPDKRFILTEDSLGRHHQWPLPGAMDK